MTELLKKAQKDAEKWILAQVSAFKAQNPEYAELSIHPSLVVTPKAAPGSSRVIPKLFERLLWTGGPLKTQTQIIKDVQAEFPLYKIPNSIWSRKLQKYEWARIYQMLAASDKASIRLSGCKTLSDIKKKLLLVSERASADESFNFKVVIQKDTLIVGKTVFGITKNTAKGQEYRKVRISADGKRQSFNVDVLAALLRASK